MRVLVTGGSGFIGSHVVDKLIDAGHSVRLYDLAPSPYRSPEEVDFRAGDITNLDAMAAAMTTCEAVIPPPPPAPPPRGGSLPDRAQPQPPRGGRGRGGAAGGSPPPPGPGT